MADQPSERGDRLVVVVVAGMHRSGTSLVARVVNLLGVDLGDAESLMEAKPDNPKGFWENKSVAAFNDDLLAQLGGAWDRPPAPIDGWELDSSLDPWLERARAVVQSEFGELDRVAWKDPRMSLVLPFWNRIVEIQRTLVVLREPQEVAGSLARRSGMDPERAADLWLRYTVTAIRDAHEPLVVPYAEFFTDYDGAVERLVDGLGLEAPDDGTRREIAEFFDPAMRHHRPDASNRGPVMELAGTVMDLLAAGTPRALVDSLVRGWQADEVQAKLERVRFDLDDMIGQRDVAVGQRDDLEEQLEASRTEIAIERERIAVAHEALGRTERIAERLGAELKRLREQNHTLKKKLGAEGAS